MAVIKNIVATADLCCALDLFDIADALGLKYYPRRFSGLTIRRSFPYKAHCQIYRNGKITVNGGTSEREAEILCDLFCDDLRKLGYVAARVINFKVVNIVACMNANRQLRLDLIFMEFNNKYKFLFYEPELFPGLTVKLCDRCERGIRCASKCQVPTFVIFASGKANILGAKTESDVKLAEMHFRHILFC